jgi:hypothetical protein
MFWSLAQKPVLPDLELNLSVAVTGTAPLGKINDTPDHKKPETEHRVIRRMTSKIR